MTDFPEVLRTPEVSHTSWQARHERFNPGPPSMTKRQRRDRAHVEALIEDTERGLSRHALSGATDGAGEAAPQNLLGLNDKRSCAPHDQPTPQEAAA